MKISQMVRPPAVAGMFYDDSPSILKKKIEQMFARVQSKKINGNIRAIISPHAGYIYSGFTAANAYSLLKGSNYDCVIVVGASHREYYDAVSIYPGKAYETPLGKIPINEMIRNELANYKDVIKIDEVGHRSEHSIEVQLPFLQFIFNEFEFVPLIMGTQSKESYLKLSKALMDVCSNRNILLVASSDLSHYHSVKEAEILDKRVIEDIESYEPDIFFTHLENNLFEACGGGPIAVIMKTAKNLGANKAQIVHYCNSGDVTGDKSAVVGYLSAAFVQIN